MLKNIAIFDLDGTLYSRENKFFHFLELKTQNYIMNECPYLTLEHFNEMERNIPSIIDAIDFLKIPRKITREISTYLLFKAKKVDFVFPF